MTPKRRKLAWLTLASLAIAIVHFTIAYQLTVTNPAGGISPASIIFVILGTLQLALTTLGFIAMIRQK